MKRNGSLILALPLLAGCISQSDIQRDYVRQQDDCRSEVAQLLSQRQGDASEAAAQAAAGVKFSECMNAQGWRVSIPKTAPGPVAQGPAPNPPSGSPSTNPIASAASAPAPASGGVSPSEGTAAIARGTHTPVEGEQVVKPAPSTAAQSAPVAPVTQAPPPAQVYTPTAPTPARYQPARPEGTQSVPYGTGGGRRF